MDALFRCESNSYSSKKKLCVQSRLSKVIIDICVITTNRLFSDFIVSVNAVFFSIADWTVCHSRNIKFTVRLSTKWTRPELYFFFTFVSSVRVFSCIWEFVCVCVCDCVFTIKMICDKNDSTSNETTATFEINKSRIVFQVKFSNWILCMKLHAWMTPPLLFCNLNIVLCRV